VDLAFANSDDDSAILSLNCIKEINNKNQGQKRPTKLKNIKQKTLKKGLITAWPPSRDPRSQEP